MVEDGEDPWAHLLLLLVCLSGMFVSLSSVQLSSTTTTLLPTDNYS